MRGGVGERREAPARPVERGAPGGRFRLVALRLGQPQALHEQEGGEGALRIRGDSMIGVGIMDDDLVIIRQDVQARNGDIVIALLEDEVTCKTLNITPDGVWLMPENPAYQPIDGNEAQILGKVKAVIRTY